MQEFENALESLEGNLEVWQQRLEDPARRADLVRHHEFMNNCCCKLLSTAFAFKIEVSGSDESGGDKFLTNYALNNSSVFIQRHL